ncbi:MAG: prephenate dehydratase [Actinobacteria bacterium]|nr:prephenate dehydratase [Actinomycetota bacterium]
MPRIGYLGPQGTFTQEALNKSVFSDYDETVSYSTVREVLLAVNDGDIDNGMVPIENSIEGSVNVTIDTLASETELLIEREVVLPIRLNLVLPSGVPESEVSRIYSHPHATAQCRRFLADRFPGADIVAANSTAEAAIIISEAKEPLAAIATDLAADIYGLTIAERDIEDFPDNKTRFVLVGKRLAKRTGEDKTSMVCFIKKNRPGSLLEILREFASRDINLTKIESRPTRKALGEYFFFIDVEGHIEDEKLAASLIILKEELRELKLLGSYPATIIT